MGIVTATQEVAEEMLRDLEMRKSKQGLVAPNGEPSNLSPELWGAVRLKSFKDWFGDWENDPANASKVYMHRCLHREDAAGDVPQEE